MNRIWSWSVASLALIVWLLTVSPAWSLETIAPAAVLQNAATATGDGTALNVEGFNSVILTLTISATATVTFETGQMDSAWTAVKCVSIGSSASSTTATVTGLYTCGISGLSGFRTRISTYGSGTVTVNARATTAVTNMATGFLFDSNGNLIMSLGTLISGEDQTNNLLMTSGGAVRGTEGNLINSAVGNATSAAFTLPTGSKSITARITGAGAVAQVITIYGGTSSGMAAATSTVLCTITLSGTNGAAGTADMCPVITAPVLFYIAVTSGSSGTPTTILTGTY